MSKLKKAVVELTNKKQHRNLTFESTRVSEDNSNSIFELSVASEVPYLRGFGYERLPMNSEAADISRVGSGMAVLYNHQSSEYIGIVEKMWFTEGTMRAVLRFSKNSELAKQIQADVEDKILRSVSIGYSVTEWDNPKTREKLDDIPIYTANRWELFEISIVSIPADASVGFGRQMGSPSCPECDSEMDGKADGSLVCPNCGTTVIPGQDMEPTTVSEALVEVADDIAELVEVVAAAGDVSLPVETETENSVAQDSPSVVEVMGCKPEKSIDEGQDNIQHITILENKMDNLDTIQNPNLRLTEKEQKQYSLNRAIMMAADGKRDGFEFEISQQIAKDSGREPSGFFMPTSLRTFNITDAAGGANIVFTQEGAFIDYLRNKAVAVRAGAQTLSLSAKTALPRLDSDSSAVWVTEEGGTTIASASLSQVTLSPKKLITFTGYTRETLTLGTPSIEGIIRNNIYQAMTIAFDKAAFDGAGTSEPTGVLRTTGLPSSSFVASGSVINFGAAVNLWSKVATANADNGSLAYVTTPGLLGYMRSNPKFTYSSTGIAEGDICNGYSIFASNHIPTSQSNGHTLLFGDFSNLMMAEFGAIDLIVDPYTSKHKGIIEIGASMLGDIQVKHIAGFCIIKSMLVA